MRLRLSHKYNGAAPIQQPRGFTVFEFVVAGCVLLVLFAVLLNRIAFYQAQMEQKAVEKTINELRSVLLLRWADLVANNRLAAARQLADQNPFQLLQKPLPNYLGEYYSPDLGRLPTGNWLYDRNAKSLVYLLNHGKNFGDGQPKMLKFKVKFFRSPIQGVAPDNTGPMQPGLVQEPIGN